MKPSCSVSPSFFWLRSFALAFSQDCKDFAKKLRLQPRSGFTLVEVMMGSAVLAVTVAAVAIILNAAVTSIGRVKVMQTAESLVSARIEEARNLGYTQLGINGGIPAGSLASSETIERNSNNFTIATSVEYVDDPYDGVAPSDTVPTDYKRVRVAATWGGIFASQTPIVMWTDVMPNGLESDVVGGTIEVTVTNAVGDPIDGVTVHLEAPTASPSVSLDMLTDSSGKVTLPGAPVCNVCYRVTASKTGLTSDRTYGTSEVTNPLKPDLTVLDGHLTQVSLAIDVPSTLVVKAVRQNYIPFAGVQLTLRGSKLMGYDASGNPVYKYQQNVVTGIGGQTTVNNLEWDSYYISVPTGSSIDMAGSNPFTPIALIPGENGTITIVTAAAAANTLLIRLNDSSNNPVASASVWLKNDVISYSATQAAGLAPNPDIGQSFFTNLTATTSAYQLYITSLGMATVSAQATVSGDIIQDYILAPQ